MIACAVGTALATLHGSDFDSEELRHWVRKVASTSSSSCHSACLSELACPNHSQVRFNLRAASVSDQHFLASFCSSHTWSTACSCRSDRPWASYTCSPVVGTSQRIALAGLGLVPALQFEAPFQTSCWMAITISVVGIYSAVSIAYSLAFCPCCLGLCCCVGSLVHHRTVFNWTIVYLNCLSHRITIYYSSIAATFDGRLRLIQVHHRNRESHQLLLQS